MKLELKPNEKWIETTLASVNQIIMGQSPSNTNINENGVGLIFLQGKAEFGKFYPLAKKYCTSPTKIANVDDILLSIRAPVGPTNIATQDTVIGRGLSAIRPPNGVNKRFVFYYFRFIEPWLCRQGTGSTFKAISGEFIRELPFLLPPPLEQTEIASRLDNLLSQVDKIKARLDAIPSILKRFRQSVLAAAVSGELGKNRISNISKTQLNNTKCIGEISTKIGSGATPKGGKSVYKINGIPLIRSMNIHFDKIKMEELAFIDKKQAEKLNNVIVEKDDILLNITGASIGRVNVAPVELAGARVNQHVCIIRCKKDLVLPKYLCFYLASPDCQNWIVNENYGATRQALTKSMIEELSLMLPPINIQLEIVQYIERMFFCIANVEKRTQIALSNVNKLTQSILSNAFSGELTAEWRDSNPELISGENSAEALLERIKSQLEQLLKAKNKKQAHSKKNTVSATIKKHKKTA